MEWSVYEDRVAILALFRCGKRAKEIYNLLKPIGINERFVFRTLKRFEETGSVVDRVRSGRPRSARTEKVINAVRARIERKPLRKQKILSREMNVAPRTMSRILRDDLHLSAYKRYTRHLLTDKLKEIRRIRSQGLLDKYEAGLYRKILFTDEKIFTIEESFNKQNDRVYAHSSKEAREKIPCVQRGHHPASVMVWWAVSWDGATSVHFCDVGVKTSAYVYQAMLEKVVKPLNSGMFKGKNWIFQQDSAPAHKAKTTQHWLAKNVPNFIATQDWPSGSPDLNPLDYALWQKLEAIACSKRHKNIETLKKSIKIAVKKISLDTIRAAIDEWPDRLRRCVAASGSHFE